MGFTSFRFVPFVLVLLGAYYGPLRRRQWLVLLVASLGFCLESGVAGVGILGLCACVTWGTGILLEKTGKTCPGETGKRKNRLLVRGYMVVMLGLLAVCRALHSLKNTLLPLGLSFYALQAMGYVLDVSRGRETAEKNPLRMVLILAYFPALVQGPISRYGTLAPRVWEHHPFDKRKVTFGVQRMLWGGFKKLVIADRIAPAVAALRGGDYGNVSLIVLSTLYGIQIYGDFTGGMDIALGLSEALGIALPENFRCPFFSGSISEFWRRWHISLGEWMKEYVFYPVSVSGPVRRISRRARAKWGKFGRRLPAYLASLVTWVCTAIWHGFAPNYLVWGMMNFLVIFLSGELTPLYEKFHRRFPGANRGWYRGFQMLRTFVIMNLIRCADLFADVGEYFRRLGGIFSFCGLNLSALGLDPADRIVLAVGCVVMLAVGCFQDRKGSVREILQSHPVGSRLVTAALFLSVLILGQYGVGFEPGNFIYNQF